MPLNVELLRKIQKEITEEPKRLNMGFWREHYNSKDVNNNDFLPPCGTVGCIAGWAVEISVKEGKKLDFLGTSHNACDFLGISYADSYDLFYADEWPSDLRERYKIANKTNDYTERARVTCEAIDRFIVAHKDDVDNEVLTQE